MLLLFLLVFALLVLLQQEKIVNNIKKCTIKINLEMF